ncbi:MAG TPA: 3'-5' exonuclease [Bacteroidales bacterium]|nr:3'-5' exonuclease [Bacteroidales bacterium]
MLELLNLENLLFIDIETVPICAKFEQLTPVYQKLWSKKVEHMPKRPEDTPATMFSRAGIFSEFGKVICISTGSVKMVDGKRSIKLQSFFGNDEKKLLEEFVLFLNTKFTKKENMFCGHNVKEFDIPYLSRRMMINEMKLPAILDLSGKKPWEVSHLDTMDLWKFGDYKHFTSLELLATVLNIPTPKDDIDGSEVAKVYYQDNNLERIVTYCQKDVLTVAQLMLKYQGKELIKEENVIFA